ncbi:MAG: antitoxin [Methanomicrobiales archaeon]|nr:antitoxin [Methanomicrobiales archaeon]
MPTRTISITDEAYSRLKDLKSSRKESFSDVILKYYPKKRKLSEIIAAMGPSGDLADAIERASREIRRTPPRKTGL